MNSLKDLGMHVYLSLELLAFPYKTEVSKTLTTKRQRMKAEEERGDLNNSWSGPHTLSLSAQTGQTALHLAVRHGRVVMVRLLLSCGADANIQDSQGTTALMFASERGHTHIARLLLERSQCDLTLTDKVRPHQTNHHVTWETMLANSFLWSFSGITVNWIIML